MRHINGLREFSFLRCRKIEQRKCLSPLSAAEPGEKTFGSLWPMRKVEKWKWRIHWGGRIVVTRVHFTEDEIRARYPEAVRVDDSRIEVLLPETPAELEAARQPRGHR